MWSERYFDVETWYEDEHGDQTVALVVLKGAGSHVLNQRSTMTYEVISGGGHFLIAGEFYDAKAGNRFVIEPNVDYQDFGDLVMLATSEPAFDPDSVVEFNYGIINS